MCGTQKIQHTVAPRCMYAFQIAQVSESGGLIEQHPVGDAVAKRPSHELHIVREAASGIAIGPAPGIFESLRQIPMIKRDEGSNSCLLQGIDQPAVVVHAFSISRAGTRWLNARPGNREAIAVQVHRTHQSDVFFPAVKRIASHVAAVTILDLSGSMREVVPDRFALAVFVPCAFDLVRSRGSAPEEILRKGNFGGSRSLPGRRANEGWGR